MEIPRLSHKAHMRYKLNTEDPLSPEEVLGTVSGLLIGGSPVRKETQRHTGCMFTELLLGFKSPPRTTFKKPHSL